MGSFATRAARAAPTARKAEPSGGFPYRSIIERRLGTAIPGRAVVDAAACQDWGTPAFTDGATTAFASQAPSLRVAAHEAVHQLQHAGRTSDAGLGPEGHAHAAARAVERGGDARPLLSAPGRAVPPGARPYTEVPVKLQSPSHWDAKKPVRVSADGMIAVRQDEYEGGRKAWADSGLVATANGKLTSAGSVLRLRSGGGTITGTAFSGAKRTINEVEPENTATGTKGASMELWADCGRSGRDVMGAGGGTGGGDMVAEFTVAGKPVLTAKGTDPEAMKNEVMQKLMGGTVAEAWAKYFKKTAAERTNIDKLAGLNRYVAPEVGQGFTMSTGGAAYPGARTWNFHWAGVVMVSGTDRATLENYATGPPDAKNTDWDFQMYGPASMPGQTFFDQHKASKEHGQAPTALLVHKP